MDISPFDSFWVLTLRLSPERKNNREQLKNETDLALVRAQ